MRFYDIVLFVFLFNVSIALLNNVNAFQVCNGSTCTMPASMQPDVTFINKSAEITKTSEYSSESMGMFDSIVSMVWGFARGLDILTRTFIQATVGVPTLMINILGGDPNCILRNNCGAIGNIAFYISTIVYLVYVVGLIQFLAGRYFSTMD